MRYRAVVLTLVLILSAYPALAAPPGGGGAGAGAAWSWLSAVPQFLQQVLAPLFDRPNFGPPNLAPRNPRAAGAASSDGGTGDDAAGPWIDPNGIAASDGLAPPAFIPVLFVYIRRPCDT